MPSRYFTEDDNARSAALHEAHELTGATDENTLVRLANYILTGDHDVFDPELRVFDGGGVGQPSPADQIDYPDVSGTGAFKLGVKITAHDFPFGPNDEEIQRYAEEFKRAVHNPYAGTTTPVAAAVTHAMNTGAIPRPVDNILADTISDAELDRLRAQLTDTPVKDDVQRGVLDREASFERERDANERWRTGHAYDENPTEDGQG